MKVATLTALNAVRVLGVIQIGLGVLFWSYNALNLIPVHMLIGLLIVLGLWALAGLGLRSGLYPGLAGAAFAWGVLVIVLGLNQTQILPGALHWIVQVLHLGVGLVALGLAEMLGRGIRLTLAGSRPARRSAATA